MAFSVGFWSDGPHKSEVSDHGRIMSRYREQYLYKTDVAYPTRPTQAQIAADIGIFPGTPYINDPNATCQAVEIVAGPVKTKQPHLAYVVTVEWATYAPLPNQVSTDPTTMRTIWTLRPTILSRYIVKDRFGVMIQNAAGQPFDGGIPVDVRLGVAIARKNRDAAGYNYNNVLANSGKTNSATFLGAAPGTLQVDIESEEKYEGSYHYWTETYTFAYDVLGWNPKPMNAGFFQLASGLLTRITNKDLDPAANEDPVQEPEPLLASGVIVPPNLASRPSLCNFIEVDYFAQMNFASFGL